MKVIVRQSVDKSKFQDSSVEKILKLLFNHCESEEEGVRNVVAECLSKIALIEPAKLVAALKHVRRAAVLASSTFAHKKPNLIKGLLPELLPLLYDQTIVKIMVLFQMKGPYGAKKSLCKQYKKMFNMNNVPENKTGTHYITAVLVDEEAGGSVDAPGCGAKILYWAGAFGCNFHEMKLTNSKVILHEVIDVENDEDCPDVMILDEKADTNCKGKAVGHNSDGYNQLKDAKANYLFFQPKSSAPGSHKTISKDGVGSGLAYWDNYIDISDDFTDFDEYAYIQAHFDNVDIPPGVEAPIPCLLDSVQRKKTTANESVSFGNQQHKNTLGPWSSKPADVGEKQASTLSHASGADLSSHWSFPQTVSNKEEPTAMQHGGSSTAPTNLQTKKIPFVSSSSTNYNSEYRLKRVEIPHSVVSLGHYTSFGINHQGGTNDLFFPSFPENMDSLNQPGTNHQGGSNNLFFPRFPENMDGLNQPSVVGPSMSWFTSKFKSTHTNPASYQKFHKPLHAAPILSEDGVARTPKNVNKGDILRKYQLFKHFDTVEDHSDHHYNSKATSVKQPPKNWAKRIQEEWRILENDLPDTIFVRVYESRMDLLRAVIIGAEGTPYHDGLFFFDVFFPSSYPNEAPHFEDFVLGHFHKHANDILVACKAYMDGAQVGCLVKGGVQDVDEGDKSCSKGFKDSLPGCVDLLLKAFSEIGIKDTEYFQNLAKGGNTRANNLPLAAI
ncbi:hypothetical protein JCGZ_00317 [Jatropha curcas]|uniref:UBC core domain-containing protein n=1 Tax=Jatropha curcas TaxID=180498 RepID=A0A067LDE2_JATCU|nr:hypothetical protein JCGZ_00317 [Jatropha curcas]